MTESSSMLRTEQRFFDRPLWAPAAALVMGLLLLVLALPRLGTAMMSTSPAGLALQGKARELTPAELNRQIERQVGAVSWRPTPVNSAVLSALSDLQARNIGYLLDEAKPSLQRTAAAARVSLLLAPVNPYVWTRLAQAEMLLNGPGQYPAQAVRLSILSARYPRDLLPDRLALSLMLWGALSNDTRRLVLDQISLTQRTMPWALPKVARDSAQAGIIRVALAADPEALVRFDRDFAQLPPSGR